MKRWNFSNINYIFCFKHAYFVNKLREICVFFNAKMKKTQAKAVKIVIMELRQHGIMAARI